VDTDFILYVNACRDASLCIAATHAAVTVPCQQDEATANGRSGRPLSAAVHVCPQHWPTSAAAALQQGLLSSLVHEILHATFFHSAYLPSLLAPGALAATPRVLREARAHFGCDTLRGVLVEGSGSAASRGSHWALTALEGDIMTPTDSTPGPRGRIVSRITLGLAEDTSWYTANYSAAGTLQYGYLAGCESVRCCTKN
jgi:Leishmanolysin